MKSITIGMDIGDKKNSVCVIGKDGKVIKTSGVANNMKSIEKFFSRYTGATIAIESGSHSPWISRKLKDLGLKVLVANPRKLRMIYTSTNKSDILDAEALARTARFDAKLLYPISHRGEQAQVDLNLLKARDMLVKVRSSLVNHVRGAVKSLGYRIPSCSTESFPKRASIPDSLREALNPVINEIERLTKKIKEYDVKIESISNERYPETQLLRHIKGVGPVTSLAYVLTIEDKGRFQKSRQVGKFLGLTPRRDQSGETDKQLRITKEGNQYLRQLLVNCSHYILGPFGEESDLRNYGLRICGRGGKITKRKAVVAVARKLSVLLHRLWVTGEVYEPFYTRSEMKKAV